MTLRWSVSYADGPVDWSTVGPAGAARAAAGGLDWDAHPTDDTKVGIRPANGCRGCGHVLLEISSDVDRQPDGSRRGSGAAAGDLRVRLGRDLAAGGCRPPPPQSRRLGPGPNQTTAWRTGENRDDSDSGDLDQRRPLSGEAAWARCWRLAPQMAGLAACPPSRAGAQGGSTLDPTSGGSEGCAAAGRHGVRGWDEEAEAEAEIGGLGKAWWEEAKNAGDSVDMALLQFYARCPADPLPAQCQALWQDPPDGTQSGIHTRALCPWPKDGGVERWVAGVDP